MMRWSKDSDEHDHRPCHNGIVDDDGTLLDSAHAQDRHLRLIDDRRAGHGAVLTGIGYRERAVLYVVRSELLVRARSPRSLIAGLSR